MRITFEDGSIFDPESGLIHEPPRILQFEVSSDEVEPLSKVVVRWRVRNAESVYLNNRTVQPRGCQTFNIVSNVAFRLLAKNAVGTAQEERVVKVKPTPPIVRRFAGEPQALSGDRPFRLSWDVLNAREVFLNDAPVSSSGFIKLWLHSLTTFELVARNEHGETAQTLQVKVFPRKPSIRCFNADPSVCVVGETVELWWGVRGAYQVHLDGVGDVTNRKRLCVRLRSEGEHRFRLVARNYFGMESEATLVVSAVPSSFLIKARRFLEKARRFLESLLWRKGRRHRRAD
ncbi:MAG: hypothetical protein NZM06_04900 [Chloroherpetonaceae bacterium]|nr:hypothetical protein [Chloroherpetonaceae bacterium]